MPFCEVPQSKLEFLQLFGFEVLKEGEKFLLIRSHSGVEHGVDKKKPYLWFDDEGEALEMGALGIILE